MRPDGGHVPGYLTSLHVSQIGAARHFNKIQRSERHCGQRRACARKVQCNMIGYNRGSRTQCLSPGAYQQNTIPSDAHTHTHTTHARTPALTLHITMMDFFITKYARRCSLLAPHMLCAMLESKCRKETKYLLAFCCGPCSV